MDKVIPVKVALRIRPLVSRETADACTELHRLQTEQRIERIKKDIECKNLQINEIQQMVIEGDQDDKAKHLFNNIHGLLEAKVLLKHLYSSGVQYLLDSKLKQNQFDTTSNSLNQELKELKKKHEITEDEYSKSQKTFNNEKSELIRHYEQRILLQSGLNNAQCKDDDRFNILDQIGMLEKDREQLDEKSRNLRFQGEKSSRFASDLTNSNKDDFKRAKKIKRDRPSPIAEQSPPANLFGCNDTSWTTPGDDKVKDPDYDPNKTPSVRNKRMKKSQSNSGILSSAEIELKNSRTSLRQTRSQSNLRLKSELEINNVENENGLNLI